MDGERSNFVPVHTVPLGEAHESTGFVCRCRPEIRRLCPDCTDDEGVTDPNPDCWACDGKGHIVIDATEAKWLNGLEPLQVIHNLLTNATIGTALDMGVYDDGEMGG